jgi:hypothetical protein
MEQLRRRALFAAPVCLGLATLLVACEPGMPSPTNAGPPPLKVAEIAFPGDQKLQIFDTQEASFLLVQSGPANGLPHPDPTGGCRPR